MSSSLLRRNAHARSVRWRCEACVGCGGGAQAGMAHGTHDASHGIQSSPCPTSQSSPIPAARPPLRAAAPLRLLACCSCCCCSPAEASRLLLRLLLLAAPKHQTHHRLRTHDPTHRRRRRGRRRRTHGRRRRGSIGAGNAGPGARGRPRAAARRLARARRGEAGPRQGADGWLRLPHPPS